MPAISSKPYKVGDTVFDTKPIIHCMRREFKAIYCNNCLKKSVESLPKCSKCCQMYYCSKDCQQSDWKYHKKECKVFRHKKFKSKSFEPFDNLLLRIWLCIESDPEFGAEKHRLFDGSDICLNEIEIKDNKIYKSKVEFKKISKTFKGFGLKFNSKQLYRWYLIAESYLINLIHYEEYPEVNRSFPFYFVGVGLLIESLVLKHSCLPNCNYVKSGLNYRLVAIREISEGEELTIAAVDLAQTTAERQKGLLVKGRDICVCEKCQNHSGNDFDFGEFYRVMGRHTNHWNSLGNVCKAVICNSFYVIDWNMILYLKDIYGDNSCAVSEMLYISFLCFALYSKYSTKTSTRLWFTQIEPHIRLTHGSDHTLYKTLFKIFENSVSDQL